MELNPQPGHVVCEIDKHQALVTFNNPKRHNAMSVLMWSQLSEVMASIAVNDDIRVVVFQGAGEKAFVSGDMVI